MRSPYSGNSTDMRIVNLEGRVYNNTGGGVSGGIGVRPALFSEGTEL